MMRRTVLAAGVSVALWAGGVSAQSGSLLQAVRLHTPAVLEQARGEWRACLDAKERCSDPRSLSLLVASLELSSGAPEVALSLLNDTPAPPLLEGQHAYLLGQAHFYAREPREAAAAFQRAERLGSNPLAERARLRRAEALLAAGEHRQAAAIFDKASKAQASPEVIRQRAEAKAGAKRVPDAVKDLQWLAVRFPTHPAAEDALARLEVLLGRVPTFPLEDRFRRSEGLLAGGQPALALEELSSVRPDTPEGSARLSLLRAQLHFARGQEAEARKALDAATKGPPSIASAAALLAARRAMKADTDDATKLLAAVDEAFPDTSAGEEAAFFAGWHPYQRGRFEEALVAFERFETRHATSRRRDEVHWYRGLAELRLERPAAAAKTFQSLIATYPRSALVPQARYWTVRSRQLAGEKKGLVEGFEQLVALYPASFYARLSEVRLAELKRPSAGTFARTRPRRLEVEQMPPALSLAFALSRAGQFPEAREEIQAQASRLKGAEEAMTFAHALSGLGEFGHAYAIGARHLWGQAFSQRTPEAIALLYPLAWESTVRSASASAEVDANFVWAIMRRESAFKDWVASSADARGLMQIIPPTARAIAGTLNESLPSADALFAPSLNVRYGAWYLAALLNRFRHPALAAAAYNAGPEPVTRWVQEKKGLPLDLFVEEIPYRETRGYVKQVIADLHLYHALYGDPSKQPPLELALPKSISSGVTF